MTVGQPDMTRQHVPNWKIKFVDKTKCLNLVIKVKFK